MLGGRLKRLAVWRRGKTEGRGKPQGSPKTKGTASDSASGGVTLKIPGWFLRALGIVVVVAGVGFGVWYLAIRDTGPSAAEKQAEAQRKQDAATAAAVAQCQQQVGGLLSALEDLDSRLGGVGLSEQDYLVRVGNISAAYGQTPIKELSPTCVLNVGINAESAMNAYVDAGDTWSNCITDLSCNVDGITPQLQAQWAKATGLIDKAKQGFAQVSP
jgi:hypothetical protein